MTTVRAVEPQPAYVRQCAAALVRDGGQARMLVLRAKPVWRGDAVLDVEGSAVRVVEGISTLAVLDAYGQRAADEYLLVLTDRSEDDLGEDVLVSAWRQRIQTIREWDAVPALFRGARTIDNELRRVGSWAATALLDHRPTGGWPVSPTPSLTSTLALGSLLAHLIGEPSSTTLDGALVMSALNDRDRRERWGAIDSQLRGHLIDWAGSAIGDDAALALRVAGRQQSISPLAVALAADVLWPSTGSEAVDERRVSARARIESKVDDKPIAPLTAQRAAATGRAVVTRMMLEDDPGFSSLVEQTDALLRDLEWAEGASRSSILPAGLTARLEALALALRGERADAVEKGLEAVRAHERATAGSAELDTATMAVRLWRWLHGGPTPPPAPSLVESLQRHLTIGGWVDRAVAALWNVGGPLQQAAAQLISTAQMRRRTENQHSAQQLAEATQRPPHGLLTIEKVLADVVVPLIKPRDARVLLVVLDGMGAAAATQVAQVAAEAGLVEWIPASGARLAALAVLPTETRYSRTSLFAGALRAGHADEERASLTAAIPGAQLVHKSGLRAGGGERLPAEVTDAIAGTGSVVAAVINAIDDTIHKQDASDATWTKERLHPLADLLASAALAGRDVILTADHGYVLEHATTALAAGRAQGRWRSPELGPVQKGEVLVEGDRVLADGGRAALLWDEQLRYGATRTGYHGGAALPEITVPVLLMRARGAAARSGWIAAPPLSPSWWNDPVSTRHVEQSVPESPKRKSRAKGVALQEDSLFAVPEVGAAAARRSVADRLLASSTYRAQRERAGSRAPSDAVVRSILDELLTRDGRAHVDTLAGAAGLPATLAAGTMAALRRMLNIDGYAVLSTDLDGVTMVLDVGLLRDQFGVQG